MFRNLLQSLDLLAKFLDILEAAINGCKPDESDFVELPQFLHHQLADHDRAHFALTGHLELVHDPRQSLFHRFAADRTLLQRPLDPGAQFGLVEGLTAGIAFNDVWQHQFRGFESGESLRATQAFATPPHLAPLTREPGVGYLGFRVTAKRTVHRSRITRRRRPWPRPAPHGRRETVRRVPAPVRAPGRS